MKYDILSLGPARMDVFVKLPDVDVEEVCSIDRKRCVIELGFGEKIGVRGIEFAIGGNTGNNAVGLTRLGLKAAMVGSMGDSWTDERAIKELQKEGIDTQFIKIVPGKSGFGVVINYQEERTILSYYPVAADGFRVGDDVRSDWMYLTTAGEDFEGFYKEAVDWAVSHGTKIAFNPGSRQIKMGVEKLMFAYKNTQVLFVNREEAAKLLGLEVTDIKALLVGLQKLGPKVVVITDGPAGTYAYDGTKFWLMPIVEAPVVERTGAGDAFGSGFLGAYVQGKSLDECLKWGTVNSASVLGYIGPQAGLLTADKMQEWLEKSKHLDIKAF